MWGISPINDHLLNEPGEAKPSLARTTSHNSRHESSSDSSSSSVRRLLESNGAGGHLPATSHKLILPPSRFNSTAGRNTKHAPQGATDRSPVPRQDQDRPRPAHPELPTLRHPGRRTPVPQGAPRSRLPHLRGPRLRRGRRGPYLGPRPDPDGPLLAEPAVGALLADPRVGFDPRG